MSSPAAASRPTAANLTGLWLLFPWLRPYLPQATIAIGFLLVAAAATLSVPVLLKGVIDAGLVDADAIARQSEVGRAFAGLGVASLVLALFTAGRYYMVTWLGERVVADLRSAVYARVLTQSPVFFETTQTGEVLSRLSADTTLVQTVVG
jgi:ATP-binding cassette, subfamily B, bacterial